MDTETLFYKLLKAEEEVDVEAILSGAGYLDDDESVWLPLGGYENNFSTVGNQQADATGALVDKIINGIDAVLMARAFSQNISPEGSAAPPTMVDAVEKFFGVRGGRMESLSARERTRLAEAFQLRVIAGGTKDDPCYLLIDQGEGQTPAMFPHTFLSLNKSNKLHIPFVQGKFNAGGTGVLQFCGSRDKNYQLIVSRRDPESSTSRRRSHCPPVGLHNSTTAPAVKG